MGPIVDGGASSVGTERLRLEMSFFGNPVSDSTLRLTFYEITSRGPAKANLSGGLHANQSERRCASTRRNRVRSWSTQAPQTCLPRPACEGLQN